MDDQEKLQADLAKTVAVIASSQRGCQEMQATTTKHIDRLTASILELSLSHVRLEVRIEDIRNIREEIDLLRKNQRWVVLTIFGVIIIAAMEIVLEYSSKGI